MLRGADALPRRHRAAGHGARGVRAKPSRARRDHRDGRADPMPPRPVRRADGGGSRRSCAAVCGAARSTACAARRARRTRSWPRRRFATPVSPSRLVIAESRAHGRGRRRARRGRVRAASKRWSTRSARRPGADAGGRAGRGDVDAAFAAAAHVVRGSYALPRLVAVPMETARLLIAARRRARRPADGLVLGTGPAPSAGPARARSSAGRAGPRSA